MKSVIARSEKRPLRVLMLPDYRADNPYQELLARALREQGLDIEFPRGYRRVFPISRAALDCSEKPDVVHLHWLAPYTKGNSLFVAVVYRLKFLLDLMGVRLLGAKLVWTIHNLLPHECQWPWLDRWVRRRVISMVDTAIAHSSAAREAACLEYNCATQKIVVVPHGSYAGAYAPPIDKNEARRILSVPSECRVFLFFGMIRPYKGVEKLLMAWKSAGVEGLLIIAGKPVDSELKETIQKMGGQTGVKLILRRITDEEIPVLFSAADVAVFPFENKTLTSGSVELAKSYGLPVIAPRGPATMEALGDANDLLYCTEQPDGLEKAIFRANGLNLATSHKHEPMEKPETSWESIGIQLHECYLDAVGK